MHEVLKKSLILPNATLKEDKYVKNFKNPQKLSRIVPSSVDVAAFEFLKGCYHSHRYLSLFYSEQIMAQSSELNLKKAYRAELAG